MSRNTLTALQVFNKALLRLGEGSNSFVTSLTTDTGKYGQAAVLEYEPTLDEELRAHRWIFARGRRKLVQSLATGIATWTIGSTLVVTGLVSATPTVTTVNASKTLSSLSVRPIDSWLGCLITGTGIPAGAIITGIDAVNSTMTISLAATAGAAVTASILPMKLGWYVSQGWVPGGVVPAAPDGIPSLSKVIAASAGTLTLDQVPTVAGTAITVALQPENTVGRWYMYNEPVDCLRVLGVYSLYPDARQLPWDGLRNKPYPFHHEKGYIYTDLDTASNPYVEFIQRITDPTEWDVLFADALAIRLASKLALYGTKSLPNKANLESDYLALITRARVENLLDEEEEEEGNPFWTDR